MLLYLFERIKRVLFDVALRFVRNPNLKVHSLNLRFKHEGDLHRFPKNSALDWKRFKDNETPVLTTLLIDFTVTRVSSRILLPTLNSLRDVRGWTLELTQGP